MAELTGAGTLNGGNAVRFHWSNGTDARIHAIWLRDNTLDRWNAVLRRLREITDTPESQVSFWLLPGEAYIADNTRVLHARAAFSSGGFGWLQDCYADKDGLLSTLAALEVA